MIRLLLALLLLAAPAYAQPGPAPGGAVLRVVLPPDGTAGLEAGAEVLLLGLRAGTVRELAFAPGHRIVAEVVLERPEARDFIRRDSRVSVRHRLASGAAYLFIGRGEGAALDWSAAGLEASAEPSRDAAMLAAIEQLRDRPLPVLEDVGRISRFVSSAVDQVERGHGSLGRLMRDDTLARNAEDTTPELTELLRGGAQLVQRLDAMAAQAERMMAEQGPNGTLPQLMRRVDQTLSNLQQATRDVQRSTARLPQTLRNVEEGTGNIPGVLLQTQQTTRELELLLTQLRGMWLLGGSGRPAPESSRPAAERLRP
jgi:phospholipid/cholesterol/gamma-HCH transport system substrate-binding protein